jgi:hypothetical protein
MDAGERKEKMQSMMEQMLGGMSADEKKDMCAAMMGKMTEGLDMKEMMPRMMMGMMSGGEDDGPGHMKEMMAKMKGGGAEQHMGQMPEMMLKTMMPHCIGMMLPEIEADKRGEAAAAIVSALVEKGTSGMSDAQSQAFLETIVDALEPASG